MERWNITITFKNKKESLSLIILFLIIIPQMTLINTSNNYFNNSSVMNTNDEFDEFSILQECNLNTSWTFLMYLDGDNDLEKNTIQMLSRLEKGIKNTDKINILVLIDKNNNLSNRDDWSETRLYLVKPNINSKIDSLLLNDISGELNMGNGTTLEEFIKFGLNKFDSDHYFLNLYDHGSGIYGMCSDWTSGKDNLQIDELQVAINNALNNSHISKFDVISFCACNMALIEIAYELRNITDYFIASEESTYRGNIHWEKVLKFLKSQPMSTHNFVKGIVDFCLNSLPFYKMRTMSALDLREFNFIDKFNDFVELLNKLVKDGNAIYIINARKRTTQFYDLIKETNNLKINSYPGLLYIDLINFIENLQLNDSLLQLYPEIDNFCTELLTKLDKLIIANYQHGKFQNNANGLSIYFPYNHFSVYENWILEYTESSNRLSNIDFLNSTIWDDFIKLIYNNDFDNDSLVDWYEIEYGLDFLDNDTNNNGILDHADDFDFDGLTNNQEKIHNTDPLDNDTDKDKLLDYVEIYFYHTSPLKFDTDEDGFSDIREIMRGTDPRDKKDHPLIYPWIIFGISSSILTGIILIIHYKKKKPIIYNRFRFYKI